MDIFLFLYLRGFYWGCGFLKVPGDAFIQRRFFIYYPCGFYLGYGFTKIPGDVFIPPMCTIQHHISTFPLMFYKVKS